MCDDSTTPPRAFVLGFDGVPWERIETWTAEGELPNFARLLDEGAGGPLDSTRPATTALAWPSIATGVWPDKHGIYGFSTLGSDYLERTTSGSDLSQPALWDLLSSAVVGNVPMTYPADEIDGRAVTGMMTSGTSEGFTNPPELASEIADRIPEYRIDIPWAQYADDREAFVADLRSLVETRRDLMRLLMETPEWELFFFVYTAPDRLQHLVWDEDVLLDHYRHLDDVLGEVVDTVSESDRDTNLFVVSDHGLGPLSRVVHVNRILEREGYLVRRENDGVRGILSRLGVDKQSVLSLPRRLGVDTATLLALLPDRLVGSVASQVPGDHALYDVDYGATTAFLTEPGNVYVNDSERFSEGCVSPADVDAVKRDLRSTLSAVTDPETGRRALSVFDGDDLFPTDERAPDLVVEGRAGHTVMPSLEETAFAESDLREGCHTPEGIFLAWGPDVEPGTTPEDAAVVDVAPTVLGTVGGPVPDNLDGRVLTEVLSSPPTDLRQVTVDPTTESADAASVASADSTAVEDRLRDLGYFE